MVTGTSTARSSDLKMSNLYTSGTQTRLDTPNRCSNVVVTLQLRSLPYDLGTGIIHRITGFRPQQNLNGPLRCRHFHAFGFHPRPHQGALKSNFMQASALSMPAPSIAFLVGPEFMGLLDLTTFYRWRASWLQG